MHRKLSILSILLLAAGCSCFAQELAREHADSSGEVGASNSRQAEAPASYVLGPDDQITLLASDAEEISGKPMRIDMKGNLNLPLAGRVHAAGLTAEQLEAELEGRLKRFVKDPEIVVSITEFRSQPVSVLGAVAKPGVHQLEGRKTLFEVLSLAGGLRDDAGNTVKITRKLSWGRIPLANAKDDSTGQFSVASVGVRSIMDADSPAENIVIRPDDVISVSKADLIYVVGSVNKPGGFVLGQNETLSTLQVLSLAEGLNKTAAPEHARIMRVVPGTARRTEIQVNLKKLMVGKDTDTPLIADDILFVPNSASKSVGARATEAAIQIATGVAVYGRF